MSWSISAACLVSGLVFEEDLLGSACRVGVGGVTGGGPMSLGDSVEVGSCSRLLPSTSFSLFAVTGGS